jgi:hypothetical protein
VTEDKKGLLALREGQRSHRAPFRTIRDPEGRCIGAYTNLLIYQVTDRLERQGSRKRLTSPGYCRLDPPLPPHVLPNLGPAELQAIAYPHFGYGLLSAYSGRGLGMAAARAMVEYSKEWIEDDHLGTVRPFPLISPSSTPVLQARCLPDMSLVHARRDRLANKHRDASTTTRHHSPFSSVWALSTRSNSAYRGM